MDTNNMKYDQNSLSQVEIRSDDFTYGYSSSTEPPARKLVTVRAGTQQNVSARTGLGRVQLLRANTHMRMFHIVTWIQVAGGLICRERTRRVGCR